MPAPPYRRSSTIDPSDPNGLTRTDWLSGPDATVLARLAPLTWNPATHQRPMRDALKSAIDAHRAGVVAALLDAGVPVDLPLRHEPRDISALRLALNHRNPEMVQVLLERGAGLTPQELKTRPAALWLLNGRPRRKAGSPEQKHAREARVLDLLVDHGLTQRPDPEVTRRLFEHPGGCAIQVLDAAISHGLVNRHPDGANDSPLLAALTHGQEALVKRLLEHGVGPGTCRNPDDVDALVLAAARHAPREKDAPGRWQHRALALLEHLRPGLEQPAWQASLDRLLARLDPPSSPVEPGEDRSQKELPGASATIGVVNPAPVLRLAAAGVWPHTWWDAVHHLDIETVERCLAVEQGACAQWINEHNRTALHVLMQGLHPQGPFEGPLDDPIPDDDPPTPRSDATSDAQASGDVDAGETPSPQRALRTTQALLDHGVNPLWGSGGMSAPGPANASGALWSALDMPGPLGDELSRRMLDALSEDERAPLLARAVQDRRSHRTLERLIAQGVPLDGRWQGQTALHLAVKVPACHDRVPVLLAHGAPADVRSDQGQTPRDVALASWEHHQGAKNGAGYLDQVRRLDVAVLEQAVQDVTPPDVGLNARQRPRL